MFKTNLENQEVIAASPSGKKIHWLVAEEMGAPNFEMRYIDMPPDANPSKTTHHPHEHEVFVVSGHGLLTGRHNGEDYQTEIHPGDAIFIPGDEEHQWLTPFGEGLGMICIVPKGSESKYKPAAVKEGRVKGDE
ncbi:MAG: cupin domain-containing protein [Spirochaetales bacterium]|nr:cupin domain-containing protein [Spirochaetales bacterium]MCF7938160.1 cupin domain-containing protein [Spirochaetales bacterium]